MIGESLIASLPLPAHKEVVRHTANVAICTGEQKKRQGKAPALDSEAP